MDIKFKIIVKEMLRKKLRKRKEKIITKIGNTWDQQKNIVISCNTFYY